jgi:hypothetical protein
MMRSYSRVDESVNVRRGRTIDRLSLRPILTSIYGSVAAVFLIYTRSIAFEIMARAAASLPAVAIMRTGPFCATT